VAHNLNLPRYVKAYERHGAWFYYFRRKGFAQVRLPGEPWSVEFMAAYTAALSGDTAPRIAVGHGRSEHGSLAWAILSHLASDRDEGFPALKSIETKRCHRRVLERLAAKHGTLPVGRFDKIGVERLLAEVKDKPGAKRTLRNVLRRFCKWAVVEGLLKKGDPTEGIKATMPKSEGWHTMTDAERGQYKARWPIGTKARAAYEILFNTHLRCADACQLGAQHVRPDADGPHGVIYLRQQKTGDEVILPVEAAMMTAIEAYPKPATKSDKVVPLAFLLTVKASPIARRGLATRSLIGATTRACLTVRLTASARAV
jgi:site-specific recombinase XerC